MYNDCTSQIFCYTNAVVPLIVFNRQILWFVYFIVLPVQLSEECIASLTFIMQVKPILLLLNLMKNHL